MCTYAYIYLVGVATQAVTHGALHVCMCVDVKMCMYTYIHVYGCVYTYACPFDASIASRWFILLAIACSWVASALSCAIDFGFCIWGKSFRRAFNFELWRRCGVRGLELRDLEGASQLLTTWSLIEL